MQRLVESWSKATRNRDNGRADIMNELTELIAEVRSLAGDMDTLISEIRDCIDKGGGSWNEENNPADSATDSKAINGRP